MKQKAIAFVHYNTPELSEALILSVRKHCRVNYRIVVFDNSDTRPFTKKMPGVEVIDNTKGQVIDFDAELAKYPDRNVELGAASNDGSFKHIISVQKLWDILPDGFILMDSDILIRKNIDFLWDEKWAATGRGQWFNIPGNPNKNRLFPYLCYLNVPKLKKYGARYFDPKRCWNLYPGDSKHNMWDTGACVLDDIIKIKPYLRARLYPKLFDYFVHYTGGSWRKNGEDKKEFLERYKDLWYMPENKDAKIYICTHKDFGCPVNNSVYEVIDARKKKKDVADNGLPGVFYSEILTYHRMAMKARLPKTIGFCGYRKYFDFMNDVPELDGKVLVSQVCYFGVSMREQYASMMPVEDIDLLTSIIDHTETDFATAWHKALEQAYIHPCSMFVMPSADFKRMMALVDRLLDKWVETVGIPNIEKRISDRMAGHLGERLISAWIDWQFPQAVQVPIRFTAEKE